MVLKKNMRKHLHKLTEYVDIPAIVDVYLYTYIWICYACIYKHTTN